MQRKIQKFGYINENIDDKKANRNWDSAYMHIELTTFLFWTILFIGCVSKQWNVILVMTDDNQSPEK